MPPHAPVDLFQPVGGIGGVAVPPSVDPLAAARRSAAVVGTADQVLKALKKGNDAGALQGAAQLRTQLIELFPKDRHPASFFQVRLLDQATAKLQTAVQGGDPAAVQEARAGLQELVASTRDLHEVRAGIAGPLSREERQVERLIRSAGGALEAFQGMDDLRGLTLAARAQTLLTGAGRSREANLLQVTTEMLKGALQTGDPRSILHARTQVQKVLAMTLTGTDLTDVNRSRQVDPFSARVPFGLEPLVDQARAAYAARDFPALANHADALARWLPESVQFMPPGSTSFGEEIRDRVIGLRAALDSGKTSAIHQAARRLETALLRVDVLIPPRMQFPGPGFPFPGMPI